MQMSLIQKAQQSHLKLLSVEVRDVKEFDGGFALLVKQRPDALLLTADPMILVHMGRVLEFTAKHKLPTIYKHEGQCGGGRAHVVRRQPVRAL